MTCLIFHQVKQSGSKSITKIGVIKVIFCAPKTRVINSTFRKKTMNVRIPFRKRFILHKAKSII